MLSSSSDDGDNRSISITPFCQRYLKRSWLGSRVMFSKITVYFLLSLLIRRGLGTCDALLTLSHSLQVALNRGIEGRLVQLEFEVAFDRVSHRGLLYKLRSMCWKTVFVHSIRVP